MSKKKKFHFFSGEQVLKGRSLWDQAANQSGGSWAWKKILKLRSLAQRFIGKMEGKCESFQGKNTLQQLFGRKSGQKRRR